MNIYILRSPEHEQELLTNVPFDWLTSRNAVNAGWKILQGNNIYEQAQSLANMGMLVIAICKNLDDTKPGHVALVMPGEMTKEKLANQGPALIMAGTNNHQKISLKGALNLTLPAGRKMW